MFAEGGLWVCEVGEGGQKAQNSNYRKVIHGIIMSSMATIANNTILKNYFVYLKVAKRVGLKSPHHTHTKDVKCEMMGVRWTYHGDSVTIYTDSESLCCTPNMNMKGCVSYASIKKKKKMVEG